jgi:hypothetical protein
MYILLQVLGEFRGEAPKELLEESPVYLLKTISKASSLASIRFSAACMTSCSRVLWVEWKGKVVGALSERNSASRSLAKA